MRTNVVIASGSDQKENDMFTLGCCLMCLSLRHWFSEMIKRESLRCNRSSRRKTLGVSDITPGGA